MIESNKSRQTLKTGAKMDKKVKTKVQTQFNVSRPLWARFKAILDIMGKNKHIAMTEAVQDWVDKNKGVLK